MPTNVFSGGFVVPAMMGGCDNGMVGGGPIDDMKQKWAAYGQGTKWLIAFIVVVAIVVIALAAMGEFNKKPNVTPVVGTFMGGRGHGVNVSNMLLSLYRAGIRVYTRSGCGWCDKQKKEVPGLANHPINIDCGRPENAAACAAVQGFPDWQNMQTGEKMPGYKSLDQLEKMMWKATS